MAFQDVINNYGNGANGTITTADGDSVRYTIISTATTVTTANSTAAARISADGLQSVEVNFDNLVRGVTLKFDRGNPGEIYKIEIDGALVDIQALIASGDATFASIIQGTTPVQTGTHVIEDGGVTSTGSFDNNSLGFLTINIPIDRIKVFGTGGNSGNFDIIEIGIDSVSSAVVCFAADTELQTPDGPCQVAALRAGDEVLTRDGQTRRIVATHARHIRPIELYRETRLLPVTIKAGALGAGLPTRDLSVSRQHRILVASRIARRICGAEEVLIPAFRLVGLPGIDVARTIQPISYYHILLDRHDIVLANGAPAETLFVGPVSAAALQDDDDAPDEVSLAPELPPMTPARPFATADQARQIVAAHLRHQRPLLEELSPV